jgi:hypothetical protein
MVSVTFFLFFVSNDPSYKAKKSDIAGCKSLIYLISDGCRLKSRPHLFPASVTVRTHSDTK